MPKESDTDYVEKFLHGFGSVTEHRVVSTLAVAGVVEIVFQVP